MELFENLTAALNKGGRKLLQGPGSVCDNFPSEIYLVVKDIC